ncbi:hypothetical protein QBC38DRAFT_491727 [Podospora fimiseda]|uniref:Uncharacterized protein n=1 Tax=Podospora fimiseda TaxID=252190 RepID=A0AAN6YN70_9PEZI|nr:hypothetical protein QBC38DRAFT_491727 [Podospora fimiseda]
MANNTPNSKMARLITIFGLLATTIQPATAAVWEVTSYFVETAIISKYPNGCSTREPSSCESYTYTTTRTVLPEVTPTAKPTRTVTTSEYYNDVAKTFLFLEPGSVPESQLIDPSSRGGSAATADSVDYVVSITYTAPARCPTAFTVATRTLLYVPYAVTPFVKPTSEATRISTNTRGLSTTEYTYVTKYLDLAALPTGVQSSLSGGFDYTYYIENCRNPTATGKAYYGPYDDDDSSSSKSSKSRCSSSSSSSYSSYRYRYISTCDLQLWIIIIATVLPTLFVLGFIESFIWFRRLMCGKQALRFGTVCWCLMSLWVTCFTRNQQARSLVDQKELTAKWKEIPAGRRIKLWLKWGFRHKYPVELLGDYSSDVVQVVTVVVDQNGNPVKPAEYPAGPGEKGVDSAPSTAVGDANAAVAAPTAPAVTVAAPAPAHVAGQATQSGDGQQGGSK